MLCWCIGGVIAICGAVGYGRLALLVPQSGGEYLYLSRHVHPLAGFLAGWVSLTAGFSGAIATAAVGFDRYAVPDTVRPDWLPPDLLAIALVVVCGMAHGIRATTGKFVQNLVVCVKLLALAAFGVVVLVKLNSHPWQTVSGRATDVWCVGNHRCDGDIAGLDFLELCRFQRGDLCRV